MQPLDGIRVFDLRRVLAGPYCTMVLGVAEVIVESQDGDETCGWSHLLQKTRMPASCVWHATSTASSWISGPTMAT